LFAEEDAALLHTHIHIHTHTYIHMQTKEAELFAEEDAALLHTHIHIHTHTYIHMQTKEAELFAEERRGAAPYAHTHTHTYKHTYIHTYIHMQTKEAELFAEEDAALRRKHEARNNLEELMYQALDSGKEKVHCVWYAQTSTKHATILRSLCTKNWTQAKTRHACFGCHEYASRS
jgi:hypothetical protein